MSSKANNLRRLRLFLLLAPLLAGIALLAAACGGSEAEPASTSSSGNGSPAAAQPEAVTLDLVVGDYFFRPNSFTAKPGQKITIKVVNQGQAVHTVRVAGADNRYDTNDDATSNPELIRPNQTAEVTWTAPQKTGLYKFKCDYHPEETGNILVQ